MTELIGVARTAGLIAGGCAAIAATWITQRMRPDTAFFLGAIGGALLGHVAGIQAFDRGGSVVVDGVEGVASAIGAGLLGAAVATGIVMLLFRVPLRKALAVGSFILLVAGATTGALSVLL